MRYRILLTMSLGLFVLNASYADTFRQSIGAGEFDFAVSYEKYKIENKLVRSNSVDPKTWDYTYRAPVERHVVMPRLVYGISNRLDVFAGIGYCDETWNARRRDTGARYTEQSGRDAIYEVGVKGTALEAMGDKLYLAYLMKFGYLRTGNRYSGPPNPGGSRVTWKQYDVDLELGYRLEECNLTPYAGISYLDLEAKQYLDGNHNKYKNVDDFCYFIGINKEISENISLDVAGNFGGRKGIGISLRWDF